LGETAAAASATPIIPKPKLAVFKDPVGLFEVGLPKGWFKVRPTVAGDLPNANGVGRRGARIFSAGDVSDPYAAKILSVERYPASALLLLEPTTKLQQGSSVPEASPSTPKSPSQAGDKAETWREVGSLSPAALANALVNRRDAETSQAQGMTSMTTRVVKNSVEVSGDGKTLRFMTITDVPVMRPDLLEEQTGRREIVRLSLFRGEIRAGETMKVSDEELPRAIITALWTSVENGDYESDPSFRATIDAVTDSFEVK